MSKENRSSNGGITFFGALQVLFIGLKLTHLIDWPWWQVFLPLIVNFVLIVFLIFVVVVYEKQHPHW